MPALVTELDCIHLELRAESRSRFSTKKTNVGWSNTRSCSLLRKKMSTPFRNRSWCVILDMWHETTLVCLRTGQQPSFQLTNESHEQHIYMRKLDVRCRISLRGYIKLITTSTFKERKPKDGLAADSNVRTHQVLAQLEAIS